MQALPHSSGRGSFPAEQRKCYRSSIAKMQLGSTPALARPTMLLNKDSLQPVDHKIHLWLRVDNSWKWQLRWKDAARSDLLSIPTVLMDRTRFCFDSMQLRVTPLEASCIVECDMYVGVSVMCGAR